MTVGPPWNYQAWVAEQVEVIELTLQMLAREAMPRLWCIPATNTHPAALWVSPQAPPINGVFEVTLEGPISDIAPAFLRRQITRACRKLPVAPKVRVGSKQ